MPAIEIAKLTPIRQTTDRKLSASVWLQFVFVATAGVMAVVYYRDGWFQTLALTFTAIVLEAFPFVLLGALIGGIVEQFVSREWMVAILPKRRWLTILTAASLGVIFPICECGVVPVVKRFIHKGAPIGASVAYMLGGPIVNPLVASSTAVAYRYNWEVVLLRVGIGYVVAALVGLLAERLFAGKNVVVGSFSETEGDDACGCEDDCGDECTDVHPTFRAKLTGALRVAADDFFDITRYLIIGAFIAGVFQTAISQQSVGAILRQGDVIAVIVMMGLAVALNLCSEADAFVAASFGATAVPLTAQMAFMVLGPMLDVKLLLMVSTLFTRKTVAIIAAATVILVFGAMMLLGAFVR